MESLFALFAVARSSDTFACRGRYSDVFLPSRVLGRPCLQSTSCFLIFFFLLEGAKVTLVT
jgi:hypothetical protein